MIYSLLTVVQGNSCSAPPKNEGQHAGVVIQYLSRSKVLNKNNTWDCITWLDILLYEFSSLKVSIWESFSRYSSRCRCLYRWCYHIL